MAVLKYYLKKFDAYGIPAIFPVFELNVPLNGTSGSFTEVLPTAGMKITLFATSVSNGVVASQPARTGFWGTANDTTYNLYWGSNKQAMGSSDNFYIISPIVLKGSDNGVKYGYNGGTSTRPYMTFWTLVNPDSVTINEYPTRTKAGTATIKGNIVMQMNLRYSGSASYIYNNSAGYTWSSDPYDGGGTSGTGGGGGNFSDQSDEIDFGSTPNISLGSTGLCNAFSPTKAELTELGNYMWGTLNIENYRRIFADPMDVIIGLSAIPISPQLGSKKEVFVGNIGTGLTMSEITRNFVTLACGAVSLDEYWGSYLDYSPSTTVEIYLPFIGYHKLDTNEVMGRQVNLLYQVDVITGSCLAQVMTIDEEGSRKVIATYQGNCGYQLPISGTNWSSMFGSALGMVGTAAIAIGSGGTALPMVAPTLASTALNASKDDITRSGSIGGNPTLGMPKTPYLIITRPNQALPEDQNKYIGYPSFITVSLSELEGYTEFETIHLEGIPATDEELTELETMLKEGVIF